MRLKAILSTLPIALAMVVVAPAPAAHAVICQRHDVGAATVALPYLSTGYGPVAHGTIEVIASVAQPGFYSPLTGQFQPSTSSYFGIYSSSAKVEWAVLATDGLFAKVCGYRALNTAYGFVIFGTQYHNGYGRWGNYNLGTNMFYPDGSGWSPIA